MLGEKKERQRIRNIEDNIQEDLDIKILELSSLMLTEDKYLPFVFLEFKSKNWFNLEM